MREEKTQDSAEFYTLSTELSTGVTSTAGQKYSRKSLHNNKNGSQSEGKGEKFLLTDGCRAHIMILISETVEQGE